MMIAGATHLACARGFTAAYLVAADVSRETLLALTLAGARAVTSLPARASGPAVAPTARSAGMFHVKH